MPEVMDAPAQTRHLPEAAKPYIFDNREKARAAGLRSAEVRRNKALQRLKQDKPPDFDTVQATVNGQLELVAEQITYTRAVLNDKHVEYCPACERSGIEPHHRAQLLKALDSLLDRQRVLLGIPTPGSRRPGREREPRRAAGWLEAPRPVEPTPGPALVPAAVPDPGPSI